MLPDPLTGLTGTESAMRLLQSAYWSCMPYNREAISIFRAIAELSPKREWFPKHLQCMQQVNWPKALFSCTALDAFHLVVQKLISDSNRLRFLFPSSDAVPFLPQANSTLLLKYYWRSRETFGKETQIMDCTYEKHFGGPPALSSVSMNLCSEEQKIFRGYDFLRSLAEGGHRWRSLAVSQAENFLSGLLLNCRVLNGASGGEIKLRDSTVSSWRTMAGGTFAQTFLSLYNLAREVKQLNDREHFTLLLSVLAYLSVDPLPLSILHCVAVHAAEFQHVTPPKYAAFEFTNEAKVGKDMAKRVVNDNLVSFDEWMSKNGGAHILVSPRPISPDVYEQHLTNHKLRVWRR